MTRLVVLVICLWASVTGPAGAQQGGKALPDNRAQIELSFAPLVAKAAPAVVNIFTTKQVQARQVNPLFNDPFFRRFFGDRFARPDSGGRREQQNSLGSGVIVDPSGVIVTNLHVIQGADAIRVVLADRREMAAQVIGSDEKTDLAFLRVDNGEDPLPFLAFRDSDELEVGDLVLAIGNPFGVGQTVTSGIVSALARTQVGVTDVGSFIQTDAAINPGNSGGALVGLDGKLAGVNTAIFSRSGGSHGIGFAIPANLVRSVLSGLTRDGRVVRPWLGAWGEAVTQDIAFSFGLDRPGGALINRVYPNGPAARAGIRPGDLIVAVDGRAISEPAALTYRIATRSVGETARIDLLRKGQRLTVDLSLEPPSAEPPANRTLIAGRNPLTGAEIANMSPALAEEVGEDDPKPGVYILRIRRGSPAARLRFRPGDRLLSVNRVEATSVAAVRRVIESGAQQFRMQVDRGGKTLELTIGG
ncbi:MAG: Do family serine endopeptidase [Magnetovibrionaceae bacterium]